MKYLVAAAALLASIGIAIAAPSAEDYKANMAAYAAIELTSNSLVTESEVMESVRMALTAQEKVGPIAMASEVMKPSHVLIASIKVYHAHCDSSALQSDQKKRQVFLIMASTSIVVDPEGLVLFLNTIENQYRVVGHDKLCSLVKSTYKTLL